MEQGSGLRMVAWGSRRSAKSASATLRAHAVEELGQLAAHGAGAEDDQARGIHARSSPAVRPVLDAVQALDRRDRRQRTGRDHEPLVAELLTAAASTRPGLADRGLAAHQLDVAVGQPLLPRRVVPVARHLVAVPEHPARCRARRRRLGRTGAPGRCQRLCRAEERLGRHAGVVRALAADEPALDQRHPGVGPEATQRTGEGLAGRAAADDENVPGHAALYAPRRPAVCQCNDGVRPHSACGRYGDGRVPPASGQSGVGQLLDQEARVARGVVGRVRGLLRELDREPGERRQLGRDRQGARLGVAGDHLGHEPHLGELGRRQPPPEQDQLLGPERAGIAFTSRTVPPELGTMPILDLRQTECRGRIGDAEVARQRKLEPAAQAPPPDRRDRRLRKRGDPLVDAAGVAVVGQRVGGARLLHLAHVGPGRERPLVPGDHDRARRPHPAVVERPLELALERRRERVQLVGAVEANERNGPRARRSRSGSCLPPRCGGGRGRDRPSAPCPLEEDVASDR